jgi:3-hydroxybutyryl-CoA dehydratase
MVSQAQAMGPRQGLYYEDYFVGMAVTTAGRTVTEADIVNFAGLSGDWTQIHVDAEYVKGHPFGQRVAHGLLGMSIASALLVRTGLLEGTVIAFRQIDEWKFSRPVYIGDTIHVRAIVTELKPMPRLGGGSVSLLVEILNQSDLVTQHGTWTMLVMSRNKAGPAV